jgi:hypothetical protein
VSNDEGVRRPGEDEEEVIEVITHSDDEEDWEGTEPGAKTRRSVDIIGDRAVRRQPPPQPPGCLYSFLLLLVGITVGCLIMYCYREQVPDEADQGLAMAQSRAGEAANALRDLGKGELETAYDYAVQRNYGDARKVLERVSEYLSVAGKLKLTSTDKTPDKVREALELLKSDEAADQAKARALLAELTGKRPEPAAEKAGGESGAESAASESAAATEKPAADAAKTEDAKESGAAAKPAEPATKEPAAPAKPAAGAAAKAAGAPASS